MEYTRIRRGDIFLANLDPVVGSEQGGTRPVLIVQNNTGNRFSPGVITVPITSKQKGRQPTHVDLGADYGLSEESMAEAEQIRSLDKSRLIHCIGYVRKDKMRQIDRALKISLSLETNEPTRITLCRSCAARVYNSKSHVIRRIDRTQKPTAICAMCDNNGFDYWLTEKKRYRQATGGSEHGSKRLSPR